MSAPSGIKVPPTIGTAFADAQSNADNVRAVVFTIEGDSFQHLTTLPPSGDYADDITLLPSALPSPKTPASFAYRLDSRVGGNYEWMMVTFVPDDAGVRAKMLQASSRGGLMKALGAGHFKHDWFATSIKDLTPQALKAHLKHMESPPPLTASEAALAEIRAAEAEEAKRIALDTETAAARRKAVIGLGGKTQWQDGVMDALTKVAERSDEGWIVTLEIDGKNTEAINLLRSEACKPDEVASKVPPKSPAYVFYSYPTPPPPKPVAAPRPASPSKPAAARNMFQATTGGARAVDASEAPRWDADDKADEKKSDQDDGKDQEEGGAEAPKDEADASEDVSRLSIDEPEAEAAADTEADADAPAASPVAPPRSPSPAAPSKGRVLFIYWCPPGSPVRFRMVYSTTVRGIQQDAMDKAGVEISGKLEESDKADLAPRHLKDALPADSARPSARHSNSLPLPKTQAVFGAPAPAGFGKAPEQPHHQKQILSGKYRGFTRPPGPAPVFGAPAPAGFGRAQASSASDTAVPQANPAGPARSASAPTDDDGDSKDRIRNAFDAFGPRVGGNAGGGFARPRPARRQ